MGMDKVLAASAKKFRVKQSKYLSHILRHHPETINLTRDGEGFCDVEELLSKQDTWCGMDRIVLEGIVADDSKQRFEFNHDHTRIRACQGHSVHTEQPVDITYPVFMPTRALFHGTSENRVSSIMENGLLKQDRTHVHLSRDYATARVVGSRHGKPAVFEVDAVRMWADGLTFHLSNNNVVLVEHVPAKYLIIKSVTV